MKTFLTVQVLLLVLYLVGIDGRNVEHNEYEDVPEAEEPTELLNRMRDHATQSRHRRRSRQMHGYDYPPPFYYDTRRDYGNRQQEEYLSSIVKALDEIISYIRRPLPPQPIYIPYPVVQYAPCNTRPQTKPGPNMPSGIETTTHVPNVTDRFPDFEDDNQLWGSPVEEVPPFVEGDDDGSRPINLTPIRPARPTSRPPPAVNHGINQAGIDQTTAAPVRRPGPCETAILTCCSIQGRSAQRNCFARYDCMKTFSTNRACDPGIIKRVLDHFSNAYAPITND